MMLPTVQSFVERNIKRLGFESTFPHLIALREHTALEWEENLLLQSFKNSFPRDFHIVRRRQLSDGELSFFCLPSFTFHRVKYSSGKCEDGKCLMISFNEDSDCFYGSYFISSCRLATTLRGKGGRRSGRRQTCIIFPRDDFSRLYPTFLKWQ